MPESIKRLNDQGWLVIVVTNQSGIARGYYNEDDMHRLHDHIQVELANIGARVDAWYFCPHHTSGKEPYNVDCTCRKPLPGMLLKAAAEHSVDLASSWMIGDKMVDLEAGEAAGCRTVLVRTGYGADAESVLPESVMVVDDLPSAVDAILLI